MHANESANGAAKTDISRRYAGKQRISAINSGCASQTIATINSICHAELAGAIAGYDEYSGTYSVSIALRRTDDWSKSESAHA